jgi:HAD superfamily hydrolase (TIGR01490 family)
MKLAIFDIDGTLLEGSTEQRFWQYLARRGLQGPWQVLAYAWFWLRFVAVYGTRTAKKNKAYLAGLAVAEIESLAAHFVTTEIVPHLYSPAVTRLQQHRRRGDSVVLISGTLEAIARPLAAALGVEHVRATVCRQRDGFYLAGPPEVHPLGATKLALATEIAAQLGADLREASAYADSRHDLALLEAVGNPVAVRPDSALLATARGNRWDIIASHEALPQ